MKPGRLDEKPIRETISTSWGAMRSSTIASLIDFSTPKSPHPGHQSGWTSASRSLSVSSAVAIVVLPAALPDVGGLGHRRVAAVDGARVRADDEGSLACAVRAAHEVDLPDGLPVAVRGDPLHAPGSRPLLHVDADVVVGHLAGFVLGDREVGGLAREEPLHARRDPRGLEGLAVVAGEHVVDADPRLGPQVPRELAGEVVLDHDRALAGLQDRG